ncbi:hypothetical protein BOTBODRAFT_641302 [Botryobasidium botryosum FD-172 SS1]|uniref:Uncharacterized protein n=1 Tax=Botryobasidium botryosum (strain FD-172 SS1) TaxID=930990 RepID=A0A067M247_BOTB1|nr:hypothetical protein BOTBODRAFT_641302 [Botryobasidium botryosum FD-172 SS1]
MLKVALCYLTAIHPKVVSLCESQPASDPKTGSLSVLLNPSCTMLVSIILAAKFLQDHVYSNCAWAKLTGLDPIEVTHCERALGDALSWCLWVDHKTCMDEARLQTCLFSKILHAGIQSSEMQMVLQCMMSSISTNIQLPRLSLPFPIQVPKPKSQESSNGILRTYSESVLSSAIVNLPIFGLHNNLPGSPLLTFLNSPYTTTSIDAAGVASFAFLGNIGPANNTSNNNGSICSGQQYASPFQLTPLQSSSSLNAAKPTAVEY